MTGVGGRDVSGKPRMLAAVGSAAAPPRAAVGTLLPRVRNLVGMACVVLVIVATPVAADTKKTQVFPLASSGLPDKLAGAPTKLTTALATAIKGTVASVPIEDVAGLLECDPEGSTCLASVAKSLNAERLVFGTITYHVGGKVKVTLTRFDVGPDRKQQTFELSGGNADQLASELVKSSVTLFGGEVEEPNGPTGPGPEIDPPPTEPKTMPGKITTSTWAMVGGGAVFAAGGIVMLVSAQSIKRDVQNAPTDTIEDIQRLRALEDRGAQRTLIGNVLLIGGGAALAAGVVRAIIQRKSSTPAAPEAPLVQPVPTEGGAVIVLTVIR